MNKRSNMKNFPGKTTMKNVFLLLCASASISTAFAENLDRARYTLTIGDAASLNRQIADDRSRSYGTDESLRVSQGTLMTHAQVRGSSEKRICLFKDVTPAKNFSFTQGQVVPMIGEFLDGGGMQFMAYDEESNMGMFCFSGGDSMTIEDIRAVMGSYGTLSRN